MHFFHRSCELTGKEVTRRPNRHEKKADQKLLTLPRLKGTLWPSLLKDAQNSYYFPLKQRRMSDKLTFCTATHARADQPLLAAALPHLLTDQPPSCLTCSHRRISLLGVSINPLLLSALLHLLAFQSHLFAVHLFCSLVRLPVCCPPLFLNIHSHLFAVHHFCSLFRLPVCCPPLLLDIHSHLFAIHLFCSMFILTCSLSTSFACCSISPVHYPLLLLAV